MRSAAAKGAERGRSWIASSLKTGDLSEKLGGPVFVFVLIFSCAFFVLSCFLGNWGDLFHFPIDTSQVKREDFLAFYRAGELAHAGRAAEAYDPAIFGRGFSEDNKDLLFLNPPHALLFFEPLAVLSYPFAKLTGMAVLFASFVFMVKMVRMGLGAWPYIFMIASPGAMYAFQLLQLSPLTVALLLFVLLHSRDKPVLSGLALTLLTIKPQYGLLMPLFLILNRDWRCFFYASLGTVVILGLSVAVHGWGVWESFFSSIQHGAHALQFSANFGIMSTFASSMGKWGFSETGKMTAQLVAVGLGALVLIAGVRRLPRSRAVPVSLLAMGVAAPSFMFYDWLLFSVVLLLVAKEVPHWPLALQFSASVLWIAPALLGVIWAIDTSAAMLFSSLFPLISVLVLLQIFVLFLQDRSVGAEARQA